MKYAIPGRAMFDEGLVFIFVPVIRDIKNWILEIIHSSFEYLRQQIYEINSI